MGSHHALGKTELPFLFPTDLSRAGVHSMDFIKD